MIPYLKLQHRPFLSVRDSIRSFWSTNKSGIYPSMDITTSDHTSMALSDCNRLLLILRPSYIDLTSRRPCEICHHVILS
jgi:hypothetical protein